MPWAVSSEAGPARTAGWLRRRSLANLLRMGHCAPTVMQTMLEASGAETLWLVKLTAGLPGGIGNTGGECGGITAPLVLLGLRHGRDGVVRGLPVVIEKGHDLLRRFAACHGTTLCSEILGHRRLPLRCVGVVRRAPELCAQALDSDGADVISGESRDAYCRLYAHYVEKGFHCSHAVFRRLRHAIPLSPELLDGTFGFIGGTVLKGMTCSAFTAGVMAIGATLGEIENSRLRVLRMIGTMVAGGDAFADDVNAFNRAMNLGHRLSLWFAAEFGSIQCRAITQCDFSTTAGARRYIESDGVARCGTIAQKVAEEVQSMIGHAQAGPRSLISGGR